jgi:hypothetical protein
MRNKAFRNKPGSFKPIRDYAKRLLAKFNLEIQSSHFGNGRSLSMEGSTVEFFSQIELENFEKGLVRIEEMKTVMETHSHFSDDSRQDASTTYEHIDRLVHQLLDRKLLKRGATFFTDTDGCCKQYRCGNSIYLNSLLSSDHGIVIDQAIGAPGHGKDIVDGINATDKRYLAGKMCLIGTPEANDGPRMMQAASMLENAATSLAAESVRLCTEESRVRGVKGNTKHAKREADAPLKERNYNLHQPEDVRFKSIKMRAEGLKKGSCNGVGTMYNVRTDPDLGLGRAAVRHIPCACTSCIVQLYKPWENNVEPEEQPRYKGSEKCKFWPIFEGANDWTIVTAEPTKSSDYEEVEQTQEVALRGIAAMMAERMEEEKYGAFMTDDLRWLLRCTVDHAAVYATRGCTS